MTQQQYTQNSLSLRIDDEPIPAAIITPRIPNRRTPKRRLQDARSHGIPELKRCRDCDAVKPSAEFNRVTASRDGLSHYCKACSRQRSRESWKVFAHKAERHYVQYTKRLQQEYGLTIEEYNARVAAQLGECAICGLSPEPSYRLVVDHDHDTGKVRDLLCRFCNLALGHMRDNPRVMIAAAMYLRRHGK